MSTDTSTDTTQQTARPIDQIYASPGIHWVGDGFRVAGYFSAIPNAVRRLSPFLMLDYHPSYAYAPTTKQRGVGVHPHRGFETVTIAWEGGVTHHDSAGFGGTIGPGDVQWMTAASGVLHKEYHEKAFSERGGNFHMAQLWVNLPAAHKMDPPAYQELLATEMGIVDLPNDEGVVRVIAGEYQGTNGPAKTFTPVDVLDAKLKAGGTMKLNFPAHHNTAVLVMSGAVTVNYAQDAVENEFVIFGHQGTEITLTGVRDAQLLILSGEPIDEPVVQHGPFVMNSSREINEAIHDYQRGTFGTLEN